MGFDRGRRTRDLRQHSVSWRGASESSGGPSFFWGASSGISSMIVGLSQPRTVPLLSGQVLGQLVDGILHVMELAVHRLELGPDAVQGLLGAFAIGDDQQVILGDHVIGQPDLIEEELQSRHKPDAFELELTVSSGSTS